MTIAGGGYSCALAPAAGGVVLSLEDAHGPLLRGATPAAFNDPREAAFFPCVPWFGRLFEPLDVGGAMVLLKPSLAACAADLPLHGDGWATGWEVDDQGADFLQLRLALRASPSGFPFRYVARQQFSLSPGGLEILLSIRNVDVAAMPAGLGLHPYFHRRAGTMIDFSASMLWAPPRRGEPRTGSLGPLPGRLGGGAPGALPASTLDHSFVGFGGRATIASERRAITLSSDAPILHVYAPAGEDYFCLEPVSHLPGAFDDGERLNPGEARSLSMTVGRAAA